MNVKPLLILSLFSLLILATGISQANVATSQFTVLIDDTGSLGFQSTREQWVMLTVTSGAINSSVATLSITVNRGSFAFRSNETVSFTVTNQNVSNVRVYINGTQLSTFDVTATQNDNVRVEWFIPIEPILPFMFILGMIGLGGMFGSSLYFIKEVKKNVNQEVFTKFITIFAISIGLFMAWLWGG